MRLAALALLAVSCASASPRRLAVPLARKETPYSCGASALLGVLRYWGAYDGTEAALRERVGSRPGEGTDPRRMAATARELGLRAELKEGLTLADLKAALGRGATVILDLQAWGPPGTDYAREWERGHYAVLVAMDARRLYLADPNSGAYSALPVSELAARWHDYEGAGPSLWRNRGLGLVISGGKAAAPASAPVAETRPLP